MAAQRNPYDSLTQELIRQSDRIEEQYANLNKMFNNLSLDLEGAANQILRTGNAPDVGNEVFELSGSLMAYLKKAKPIFENLSAELKRYANDTVSNVERLKSTGKTVRDSIDSL